jgi:hypothetical protein
VRADFNLLDGFRIFDCNGRGYADVEDLLMGFEELGVGGESVELLIR